MRQTEDMPKGGTAVEQSVSHASNEELTMLVVLLTLTYLSVAVAPGYLLCEIEMLSLSHRAAPVERRSIMSSKTLETCNFLCTQ